MDRVGWGFMAAGVPQWIDDEEGAWRGMLELWLDPFILINTIK
jgi:hypothetical protein